MPYQENFENKVRVIGKEYLESGEIPVISSWGRSIPETWENAVIATWEYGTNIPTEYDQDIDPESRDATVMMVVTNPMQEPRIHKALPTGYRDLEVYRQEVVDGIHDHYVRDGGWSYSYHDRIKNWPGEDSWKTILGTGVANFDLPHVDQIDAIVNRLSATPHSRRAQAVTWFPPIDSEHHEPPCLQRIWCRVIKSENDLYLLEMNTDWRSRDAFKAAFMNIYALTDLQRKMAEDISKMTGRNVSPGRYVDKSDSFHIYGSYLRNDDFKRFLLSLEKRTFEQRVIRSDDPIVKGEIESATGELGIG